MKSKLGTSLIHLLSNSGLHIKADKDFLSRSSPARCLLFQQESREGSKWYTKGANKPKSKLDMKDCLLMAENEIWRPNNKDKFPCSNLASVVSSLLYTFFAMVMRIHTISLPDGLKGNFEGCPGSVRRLKEKSETLFGTIIWSGINLHVLFLEIILTSHFGSCHLVHMSPNAQFLSFSIPLGTIISQFVVKLLLLSFCIPGLNTHCSLHCQTVY